MTVTADQVYRQVDGVITALDKLSSKERQEKPSKSFGDNFNTLLGLAKEAMPSVDARRWQPTVEGRVPAGGVATSDAAYVEIHGFLAQVKAILSEGLTEPW